jgi:hypothetical protein
VGCTAPNAPPRPPPPPLRSEDEAVDSLFDVPAAVLCAFCGQSDCAGCLPNEEASSGVVAIVPWERPGGGWSRLWATANASTQGADAFFAALPDGEVSPALRFAMIAEMLAVTSLVAVAAPLVALALPNVALEVIRSPATRGSALRWLLLGIPVFATWMVLAHATHGVALGGGAKRQGARPQRRRALRFGLYACGWDLMTMPIGWVVTLLQKGIKATVDLASLSMRVPGSASMALLQGVFGLTEADAKRARRPGTAAGVICVLVAIGVVALVALLQLGS